MKKILQKILYFYAKTILAKYQPDIIGITGSVGKTSAKEAVFTVLSAKLAVRKNIKNYNNEIGLPLTIIGCESGGKSLWRWLAIFFKALILVIVKDKNYPKILILEMGIDKPGDMKYLLEMAPAKIGIITKIGHAHLEFFGTQDKIKKEKELILENLPDDGWAILNFDEYGDEIKNITKKIKARILTFGFNEGGSLRAVSINKPSDYFAKELGLHFKLVYDGSAVPAFIPNSISNTAISAALIGACAGLIYGMNLVEISNALKNLRQSPGRMNLIKGIKNTLIIDDTYNSSPESSLAALNDLAAIDIQAGARKFLILGDMLELGSYTEEGHRMVGKQVAKAHVDKLITVGERARDIGRSALETGMNEDDIFNFPNAMDARQFVQQRIKEGDLVLIKGSQGMRMERIVKEIMAEPLRAAELLVRQGDEWKDR